MVSLVYTKSRGKGQAEGVILLEKAGIKANAGLPTD
jgi:hypothetical protein